MMKTMKELFGTAKKTMEEKQDLVFVTTISSSGSSPRGAGSVSYTHLTLPTN